MPDFEQYIIKIPNNVSNIFWQTADPKLYEKFVNFTKKTIGKIHCYTNETRYKNDAWGGRNTNKTIVEQISKTTVVNGYLGRVGGLGIISPKKSMWTWFLSTNTRKKTCMV